MPEGHIDAAIDHIETAAEEIETLVAKVAGLQASRRWIRILLALIVVALIAIPSVFGYVIHRLNDERVANCRASNDRFALLMDFIDLQVDSPEGQAFVDGMRAVVVIDCDSDGDPTDDLTTPMEDTS